MLFHLTNIFTGEARKKQPPKKTTPLKKQPWIYPEKKHNKKKQHQTSNACHFDTSLCYAKVTATNLASALPAVVVFYQLVKLKKNTNIMEVSRKKKFILL